MTVLQVFCFFLNRDFNVCNKPPGNVYGLEISAWNLFEIKNFGPGIFWDFDFCTHSIIAVT